MLPYRSIRFTKSATFLIPLSIPVKSNEDILVKSSVVVIPAQAGIQIYFLLDPGFRRGDGFWAFYEQ